MQYPLKSSQIQQTHPMDDHMLVLSSVDEIPLTALPKYKGGTLENAMPEDVRQFFLTAPIEKLSQIFRKTADIDVRTGQVDWSAFSYIFPKHVVDFIDSISFEFNKAYPGECFFGIQDPRANELNEIFPRFHFDTRPNEPEATFRGIICISDDDYDHESEWVATNNLSAVDLLKNFQGVNIPLDEMEETLRQRVQVNKPGDLFMFKGLSRTRKNVLTDGSLHRSPPFKHDYKAQNIRRVNLVWNKKIELPEPDMG